MIQQNKRFTRSYRIVTANEYQRVFKTQQRIHSRYFVLYYQFATATGTAKDEDSQLTELLHEIDQPEGDRFHIAGSKIGVIASRRQLKRAVWRNRSKRLVRETFRVHPIRFQAVDLVVISKHAIVNATNAELVHCLNKLFAQLCKSPSVQSKAVTRSFSVTSPIC